MWAVIEKSNATGRVWIGGVFKKKKDAERYLALEVIYEDIKQELRKIPAKDYPVIFLEDLDEKDFVCMTSLELAQKLLAYHKKESDEDETHCLYFIFKEDYEAPSPGADNLGAVRHEHVDNSMIEYLLKEGIERRIYGK